MLKKSTGLIYSLIFIFIVASLIYGSQGHAQVQDIVDTRETDRVFIFRGDVVTLKVFSLTRIAVTEPGIFEIGKLEEDEMLLIGQREGKTTLFIWDEYGKRKIEVRVSVQDLDEIITRLEALLEAAEIEGITFEKSLLENKIIMKGKVREDQDETFQEIVAEFRSDLIDLTQEDAHLVRLDVQVTELTTTLSKTMGVLWNAGASGLSFSYPETMPELEGGFQDLFKIGDFKRTTQIQMAINMLLAEGKARVLSKPSVIVTAGQASNFTVGGEIPVRTTSTAEGSVSENVNYKGYGVTISVTPEIKGKKIDINLSVSVSDIDASNAVGDDVAFVTRSASTQLLLEPGQTIILAGLIKSNKGETVTRVPVLSKIPILGLLFRSKNWSPNKEEEIVISMTPNIVSKSKDEDQETKDQEGLSDDSSASAEEVIEPEQRGEDGLFEEADVSGQGTFYDIDDQELFDAIPSQDQEDIEERLEAFIDDEELMDDQEESLVEEQEIGEEYLELESLTAEALQEEFVFKEEDVSAALTRYVQAIQQKISQAISFPYQAKENNWQGAVKLTLIILSDGTLSDIYVEESSGYEVFDEDALNTAQLLAPFDPFPAEISLEEIKISLPIVYSQEAVLQTEE